MKSERFRLSRHRIASNVLQWALNYKKEITCLAHNIMLTLKVRII